MAVIVPASGAHPFPFSAIVGQETLKLALLLNAADPLVGGVLIRGEKGTAKSTSVRALSALLPPIRVVDGCRFACDPADTTSWCSECQERAASREVESGSVPARLVELPVSATEDRVVGTLDIEHALKHGEKRFEPGILARANRAILYVDEVNLLEDHLVDTLLDAAAMGVNTVEREGVSFRHPSRFMLVGTMNPEEGELRPQLLDRFGLCVDVTGEHDPGARVEIMRRRRDFDADSAGFTDRWSEAEALLTRRIEVARELLSRIVISDELLFAIANLALSLGVDGHRADQAMARAAAALAALEGRDVATLADVERIAPLVLAHRARRTLFDEPRMDSVSMAALISSSLGTSGEDARDVGEGQSPSIASDGQATIWDVEASLPSQVADSHSQTDLALSASVDRLRRAGTGRRQTTASDDQRGRHSRSEPASAGASAGDVAMSATLRAAAANQAERPAEHGLRINVQPSDLQEKKRMRKVGTTIVFCVDASSSMGAANRVASVRTAVLELLRDAYQNRDRVSVVAFRGHGASVVLAPTASVQLAEMRLRELPTGGATPLAAGLLASIELVAQERRRTADILPWIVLVSDCGANVGVSGGLGSNDALEAARHVRSAGINFLVVDAGATGGDCSAAKQIARTGGGSHVTACDGGHTLVTSVRNRARGA